MNRSDVTAPQLFHIPARFSNAAIKTQDVDVKRGIFLSIIIIKYGCLKYRYLTFLLLTFAQIFFLTKCHKYMINIYHLVYLVYLMQQRNLCDCKRLHHNSIQQGIVEAKSRQAENERRNELSKMTITFPCLMVSWSTRAAE